MSGRFQITLSRRTAQSAPGSCPARRITLRDRLLLILAGVLLASVTAVGLALVLVIGAISAVLLWMALVAFVVTAILRATVRRPS